MLREMTVYEILEHSARMRLPHTWTNGQVMRKVRETMLFLDIDSVANQRIGDEEKRGVSGGQRRRVNIGMELVAEPLMLFLDEPTSGLDSTNSRDVCKMLKRVAKDNQVLCVAIIHSPSAVDFREFDDLILLGKGGQTAYVGPRDQAVPYFQSLGFQYNSSDSEG